ncbi:hypothetical protein [Streptomyces griseocarneus]|uniref:hypothetical protein n=1 Tax=Streptomyces griseocarneus TaxID=51201 RepID=UPI00167D078A|nr:hypothetical protein [Streptomyces griseocarneus]MBZ6476959.1 hypothetical protein [Streptomyces griseocarneus]GHG76493.1 hypothetical protein GCM10018779_54840 [Streptomyces griseocarneus]
MTAKDSPGVWLRVLLRQFPELGRELAPSRTARPSPTGARPPAGPSAPIRLFVSDTIRDVTDGVVELEEAVAEKLGLPRPRRGTVPERLLRLISLLDRVAAHPDPALADHVRGETRRMAHRCSLALGDAETPVRVRGRCVHCDSVSLRVFPRRETILCVNPGCRCQDPACGCRTDDRYRHEWVRADWDRLGESLGEGFEGNLEGSLDGILEGSTP